MNRAGTLCCDLFLEQAHSFVFKIFLLLCGCTKVVVQVLWRIKLSGQVFHRPDIQNISRVAVDMIGNIRVKKWVTRIISHLGSRVCD